MKLLINICISLFGGLGFLLTAGMGDPQLAGIPIFLATFVLLILEYKGIV